MTTHINTTSTQLTIASYAAAAMRLTLDAALAMPPDDLRARIAQITRTAQPVVEEEKPRPSIQDAKAALAALRQQLKQS